MAQIRSQSHKQWVWATFVYFVAFCFLVLVMCSRCNGL